MITLVVIVDAYICNILRKIKINWKMAPKLYMLIKQGET